MEKIKNILSHGQDKEGGSAQGRHDTPTTAEFDRSQTGGLAGEGSHLTGANTSTEASGEHHPIYDQFAKGPHENMSNASIKSGVIGFPQGADDSHAARPNNNPFEQKQHGSNQPGAGGDLSGTKAGSQGSGLQQGAAAGTAAVGAGVLAEHESRSQPQEPPRKVSPNERGLYPLDADLDAEDPNYKAGGQASGLQQGAAAGTAAVGAGALAEHGSRTHHQEPPLSGPNERGLYPLDADLNAEHSSSMAAGQPPQINLQRQESDVGPDSGRSFPLAGGVAHQNPQTSTGTSARELGTQVREAGLSDSAGREGLAGAAAAAAATSVIPQHDGRIEPNLQAKTVDQSAPEHHYGRDAAVGGGLGAAGVGAYEATKHGTEQTQSTTPAQSANIQGRGLEQPAPEHHYGRDVAVAGGSGAAGAGAYEAAKRHQTSQPTNPAQSANILDRTVEQPTPEHHYGRDAAVAGGLGAAGIGAYEASKRHQTQPTQTTGQSANPDALAAARAAAADEHGWTHEHKGLGHDYRGDPCDTQQDKSPAERGLLFTSGPHATDTANRTDPKLHIPGEFPSPTPVEESNASSYVSSKPTAKTTPSAFAEPELRHTGSLDEPQARSAGQPTSEHQYGRDAAIAGGLGAAGVGAYAAGKHHDKDSADVGSEIFPNEPNPYTKNPVDPRLGTTSKVGFTEQRFDTAASSNRSPRNAVLTGGAIGSSQPSTQEAPKAPELSNKEYPSAGQDVKSDSQHHYGRDAATTAGLYASQRDAEPASGPASSTIGPHKSNVANVLDPRVQPDPELQKHNNAAPTVEDPAPSTVGPHKSDVANIVDPRVLPDPQKQKAVSKEETRDQQHHYGRDAAVAGGAGAAGYGAYEVAKSYGDHPSTQPSAAMNDQRYDPSARGAHAPGTTAPATSSQEQHHYGRDAAVAGGLGTAGAGAYASNRDHQLEHTQAIPGGHGLGEQRYDPSVSTQQASAPQSQHHYGRDAAVIGGAGSLGTGAYAATRDHSQPQQPSAAQGYQQPSAAQGYQQPPIAQSTAPTQQPGASQTQHHYGRDAAVVGGVGALGAGAYAATRDHPMSQQPSAAQGYQQPSTAPSSQDQTQPGTYPPQDPSQKEAHTKRNAALGAGGLAAAGAGAYGLSQHDAQKEQERQLKEQQKAQQKALHEQQKASEKAAAADQKHHDKLVAATEKKHAKEAEHKEREHAKELDRREKERLEQERAAQAASTTFMVPQGEREYPDGSTEARQAQSNSPPKEKKHRILTFLNKKDKDAPRSGSDDTSPRGSRDSPRHSKEYAAGAAGVGAAGVGAAALAEDDHEGRYLAEKKGRHVLHKEPPKNHPAYETHTHDPVGKREHTGTAGPIGDPNLVSGDHQTRSGVGAHPAADAVGGHHTVTEPHTGLPVNVDKYGDGHGGTDASRTIPGVHEAPGQTTDWDAIKKKDTLF
ncbi:uncharacterized protein CC84DRAFT_1167136 [Paraphaeosphaeria sporulosa]|uniref:Uncharacterized protein n=1 Tax=Paraphaeosphaeria sporulosa TaxID=1460663 RepID=A0A177C3C8_9PLEO|nr:uncharacterized protein CC84DRAFT_1167136 [Paraphaeosphaeria sporulosa]OAG01975.1 hypothetical protein CC84DRAFT_1167136 [Paraphaeosphaeria sporulosa]